MFLAIVLFSLSAITLWQSLGVCHSVSWVHTFDLHISGVCWLSNLQKFIINFGDFLFVVEFTIAIIVSYKVYEKKCAEKTLCNLQELRDILDILDDEEMHEKFRQTKADLEMELNVAYCSEYPESVVLHCFLVVFALYNFILIA